MLFSALLIFLTLIFSFGEASGDDFKPSCEAGVCDDTLECPQTTCRCIYPSHVDCALYYQCFNGKRYQHRCSPGLLFNVETLTCDYGSNVNCGAEVSTTMGSVPTTNSETPEVTDLATEQTTNLDSAFTYRTSVAANYTEGFQQTTEEETVSKQINITTFISETTSPSETQMNTTEKQISDISTSNFPTSYVSSETESSETPVTTTESTTEMFSSKTSSTYLTTLKDRTSDSEINISTDDQAFETSTRREIASTVRLTILNNSTSVLKDQTSEIVVTEIATSETAVSETTVTETAVPAVTETAVPAVTETAVTETAVTVTEVPETAMTGTLVSETPVSETAVPETAVPETSVTVTAVPETTTEKTMTETAVTETVVPDTEMTQTAVTETVVSETAVTQTAMTETSVTVTAAPETIMTETVVSETVMTEKTVSETTVPETAMTETVTTETAVTRISTEQPMTSVAASESTQPTGKSTEQPTTVAATTETEQLTGKSTEPPMTEPATSETGPPIEKSSRQPTTEAPMITTTALPVEITSFSFPITTIENLSTLNEISTSKTPQESNFTSTVVSSTQTVKPTTTLQFSCPDRFGLFPDSTSCFRFYQCSQYIPVLKECPSKLHYNSNLTTCDWPYKAGCEVDMQPSTITSEITTSSPPESNQTSCDCDCCELPVFGDCSAYILCIDYIGTKITCDDGLYFNPMTSTCDLKDKVTCDPNIQCPSHSGKFSYPHSCTHYLDCRNGTRNVNQCPDGSNFDAITENCSFTALCEAINDSTTISTSTDSGNNATILQNISTSSSTERITTDVTETSISVATDINQGSSAYTKNSDSPIVTTTAKTKVSTAIATTTTTIGSETSEFSKLTESLTTTIGSKSSELSTTTAEALTNSFSTNATESEVLQSTLHSSTAIQETTSNEGKTENPAFTVSDIETSGSAETTFFPETKTDVPSSKDFTTNRDVVTTFVPSPNEVKTETETSEDFFTKESTIFTFIPYTTKAETSKVMTMEYTERNSPSSSKNMIPTTMLQTASVTPTTSTTMLQTASVTPTTEHKYETSSSSKFTEPEFKTTNVHTDWEEHASTLTPVTEIVYSTVNDLTTEQEKYSSEVPRSSSDVISTTANHTIVTLFTTKQLKSTPSKFSTSEISPIGEETTVPDDFTTESIETVGSSTRKTETTNDYLTNSTSNISTTEMLITATDVTTQDSTTTVKTTTELTNNTAQTSITDSFSTTEDMATAKNEITKFKLSTTKETPLTTKIPTISTKITTTMNRDYSTETNTNSETISPMTATSVKINSTSKVMETTIASTTYPPQTSPASTTEETKISSSDGTGNSTRNIFTTLTSSTTADYHFKISDTTYGISSTTELTEEPTSEFFCPERFGLFPDPRNCSTFYQCSHLIPYRQVCPSELHFNPNLTVCDWPERAGCNISIEQPLTENPVMNCNMCDTCVIPDDNDCTSYTYCVNGTGYQLQCPKNLLFNPAIGACDNPENMQCGSDNRPLNCLVPNGIFPAENCTQFIQCSNGIAYTYDCPSELLFNADTLSCDWPENVTCGKSKL